ncbi:MULTISPECIES: chorismate synthase [Thermoanaerobacter]|jgi:chorismate synthase|uniref:Chorismate synthase n=2 Tax=Thermoanaerobacter TaxID=1754 RepID=AROC_THEP3|nr:MULTISPECIES: chorismate synthase [Thermoanaerobacter]B0K8B2.1 RecName: Full=Chorismate synthase; Short=CS; AltName: Full=5-enolpyruvylshikimate-3-phosphate phospholyase [Thermoanaerobacter pseudethanolicus ATCC 33223]ABY94425.1 Chorismate synthase [Thermoanaerobacter pseudethanolicus ATCC 33223]ADV79377.1 chorismate synthase [Thermoanaerobacter brockii subsp. finnii Ako-1]MDI3528927.1 chorismate synthase [Thermoanaerobacter sp.]HBW60021.1 chorismate synthase [Thermoanaerobacter sp.]
MRYITAGESHGEALIAVIEGLPSNLLIDEEFINKELKRRQGGYGRGGRMAIEEDKVHVLSGIRNGKTIGSPLTLEIINKDYENWKNKKTPEVTRPRPGHADLAGAIKYNQRDLRNILERSSARETAARVAVGSVAKLLLKELDIYVKSKVLEIGGVKAEEKWRRTIDEAKSKGDTLGGIIEIVIEGVPVGLGSHVQWDRKLDALLAYHVMSVQAIKAVEIGLGFEAARKPGSLVHDEIYYDEERGFYRKTNNAGGIEGGISNGSPIVIKAAMKPIPTLLKPLTSIDINTKEEVKAAYERSDVTAVEAAACVLEAVCAWVIADECLKKFGGDSIEELKKNYDAYLVYVKNF